jgi:hypothetical protein
MQGVLLRTNKRMCARHVLWTLLSQDLLHIWESAEPKGDFRERLRSSNSYLTRMLVAVTVQSQFEL